MMRLRWYDCTIDNSTLRAISSLLEARPFASRAGSGYRIVSRKRGALDFEYIERIEREEEIINPLGKIERFTSISYSRTCMSVSLEAPSVELQDPPRSFKEPLTALSQELPSNSVLTPVTADPMEWLVALESIARKTVVRVVNVEGVALDSDVSAVAKISGARDVRRVADSWLGRRDHKVTSLEVEVDGLRLELRNGARARVLAGDQGEARRLLRASLTTVWNR